MGNDTQRGTEISPTRGSPRAHPRDLDPHDHCGSSVPSAGNQLPWEGRRPANTFTMGWALPTLALRGAKPPEAGKEKALLCAALPAVCPPCCAHLSCPPQRLCPVHFNASLYPTHSNSSIRPTHPSISILSTRMPPSIAESSDGAAHPGSLMLFFTQPFSNHLRISQEMKPKQNQKSSA